LLSVFVFAGCAGKYHSPSHSANAASLTARVPVWIASIDGKPVSRAGFRSEKQIAIPPGKHIVEVHYAGPEKLTALNPFPYPATIAVRTVSTHNVMVPFVAEPGRRYFVHDKRIDFGWRPYISETNGPVFFDLPEEELFAP
jgi:hypothetical protein